MDTYEARIAALEHAWRVETALSVLMVAAFLTFGLFALWQLPWRDCEVRQLEEAWRSGRVVPIPPRPQMSALVVRWGRYVWGRAAEVLVVMTAQR